MFWSHQDVDQFSVMSDVDKSVRSSIKKRGSIFLPAKVKAPVTIDAKKSNPYDDPDLNHEDQLD